MPTPPKLQPALFGGLFIGVLSALPIISAGNCLCCMWVVAGGMLATYDTLVGDMRFAGINARGSNGEAIPTIHFEYGRVNDN